ncbi:MAG: hypothetical protein J6D21_02305 [Clostridia bacterium]|nr:hypothetical protein [Clostridia bacterium]
MPRRRNQTARKTKRLALCAVLCALGVVILGFGAILEVMDITTTMLASLLLLPIMLCYGNGYAFMTYAVTGLLSVILMPFSFAPWMYLGLAGYYPMVKAKFDRLPKLISILLKAILVLVALSAYFIAFYFLMMQGAGSLSDAFTLAFGEKGDPSWMGWVAVALAYIAFFAYDLLIDRLLVLYRYRWQARVEKWMK